MSLPPRRLVLGVAAGRPGSNQEGDWSLLV
ncbi:hypothetical protein CMUS01_09837 [Colletotrichum musicola]|uniref:Uncharacterized protein n=1 Tax=Colletotrichum musicola TaxID=2175873 RepID=A0A8H6K5B8_9PEZI|nr:hypothetical protein CMUS01_09837 [Colletotrichum musicola]